MINFNPTVWKGREAWAMQDILFEQRCIFINTQINEDVSLAICQQLMVLDNQNKTKPITLYLMSPGGLVYHSFAMIDVMHTIKSAVHTCVMGTAASAAALLLAAGEPGHRTAMKYSRLMIHELSAGAEGKFKDVRDTYKELERTDAILNDMLGKFVGKTSKELEPFIRKDHYMSAKEAKDFGLVDSVIEWQESSQSGKPAD